MFVVLYLSGKFFISLIFDRLIADLFRVNLTLSDSNYDMLADFYRDVVLYM